MHFCLGWGFIELFFATTVDFFVERGWFVSFLPGKDTPWFAWLNDFGGLLLLTGLVAALYRRYVTRPKPLPQEAFVGRGNPTGRYRYLDLSGDTGGRWLFLRGRPTVDPATGLPPRTRLSATGWPVVFQNRCGPYRSGSIWWGHAITSLLFIALLPLTKMFHSLAVSRQTWL